MLYPYARRVPPSCLIGLFAIGSFIVTLISGAAAVAYISRNGFDLDDQKLRSFLIFFLPALLITIALIFLMRFFHNNTNHEDFPHSNSLYDDDRL